MDTSETTTEDPAGPAITVAAIPPVVLECQALRAVADDMLARFVGPISGHGITHPFTAYASGEDLTRWRNVLGKDSAL